MRDKEFCETIKVPLKGARIMVSSACCRPILSNFEKSADATKEGRKALYKCNGSMSCDS